MFDTPFVFGTQYLRGMTPPQSDWDRDMERIRGLGMNTIRAWLVWGVVEPAAGKIDTGYLDRFLDCAERHSLNVGFLFHLHGAPEWAIQSHRKHWYVDAEGRAFEPSARTNTPSGGWPGLCPDNPSVIRLEDRFISRVVKHVSSRHNIAFWEPINEPHMWMDFARTPPGVFCYCPATRLRFIDWLRKKYTSLDALENAWGRRHARWQDVRPPTWRFGFSDWADWRTFTADNIASLVERRAATIRRYTQQPVIAHAWGGGCVTNNHLGAMAFDDWKNARSLDKWGYSAFPGSMGATMMVGLGTDATRNVAGDKEFWQSELGSGDHGYGFDRKGRVDPDMLAMWCWESIRHGAKGLLFWQYRKEAHGSEIGALGLTDYAGEYTENAHAVSRIGKLLTKHAGVFIKLQYPRAQVALVFSYQSYVTEWAMYRTCNLSVDSLSGYYRMFWEKNIPVDIVHEDSISATSLAVYKAVVVPMPAALTKNARDAISGYVSGGGLVISDPFFCGFDDAKALAREMPGGGCVDMFGCSEIDITTTKAPVTISHNGKAYVLANGHFREHFNVKPGASVVAVYDDGTAAIVSNSFGKGRAVMCGVNLGLAYSSRESLGDEMIREGKARTDEGAMHIVYDILADTGITSGMTVPPSIRAAMLSAERQTVLLAGNIARDAVRGEIIVERSFTSCVDLISGESVNIEGGRMTISFKAWESKVLLLS
ncbi:MAG: beta-galactosidase [Spirochaetes bacterium]|nr:beta-galactosidase [Spirochaetota bacterium]